MPFQLRYLEGMSTLLKTSKVLATLAPESGGWGFWGNLFLMLNQQTQGYCLVHLGLSLANVPLLFLQVSPTDFLLHGHLR